MFPGMPNCLTTASGLPSSDLELRLCQQELAGRFGLFALGQERLQPVLDEACRVAAEGLEVRFAKVLRHDAGRGDFLIVAGVGWRPGVVGHERVEGGAGSPAGPAVDMGEEVTSGDLDREWRFATPPVLAEHGIRSAANVPIPAPAGGPGRFWGVLEADCTGRGRFADPDTAFLRQLAATLGACVEREARRAERELLVQEVHHRVKNSLQLVNALLTTQARGTRVPEARDQLLEAAQRVATIGAVHERLYRDGSVEEADAAVYLTCLVQDLRASLAGPEAGRWIELDVPPMRLPADQLTPLGLIATELVTNALKYGQGRVRLVVRPAPDVPGGVEVACGDEGPGFPDGFDPRRSRGLGMRLVAALAKGTDAIRLDHATPGARVVVTITSA